MVLSQNAARRQELLLHHEFHQFLPPQAIQVLALRRFSDGEFLCREGEEVRDIHFLAEGRCKVSRVLGNGRESLICFYQDSAILGELELICGIPAFINTAQALGPVWSLTLPIGEARALLEEDSRFLRFLCAHLARKLMNNNLSMSINLNYPVDQRLASYIFRSCQGQERIFRTNHTHLAEYLGCSHRQLLRVLQRFRRSGLLEKEETGYRILDMDRLESLAGDLYTP